MANKKSVVTTRQTIQLWLDVSRRYKLDFALSFLTPLGALCTSVFVPYFGGKAISDISGHTAAFQSHMIWLGICVALGITLNRIGFLSLMRLQAKVMSDLNNLVFEKLLARGMQFHVNSIGGKIVSDSFDFVVAYSSIAILIFTNGSSLVLTLIIGLLLIFFSAWQLGLYLLLVIAAMTYWTYYDSRRRSHLRSVRHKASKKVISHFSDSIVNAQTVKTFAAEAAESNTQAELNEELKQLRIKDWLLAGRNGNNRTGALLVSLAILLLLVRYLSTRGLDVIGAGIFAYTYTFSIILRLFELNNITRLAEESLLNSRNTTEMLLQTNEILDSPQATNLAVTKAAIEIKNVTFNYSDSSSKEPVFDNFSLLIAPGEKIGLVGRSGGGKSTLTRLLLRFEDIQSGSISIDGQDIAQATQRSLRQAIGFVPQEPLLFHRTVYENIAYGRPQATAEEVKAAAHQARADEFIEKLPKGYDTIVGERGVKLSGGQRQRVAIARAILKDAPILLLDEATSALDSESEKLVQSALGHLIKGKTTLVIAHRLSTIQRLDRIVVLDEGKIVEMGTHEALIKQNGLYAKLWQHQSGGFLQIDTEPNIPD